MTNKFLNQDALFIHEQERILHNSGDYSSVSDEIGGKYTDSVLPVYTDKGVLLFR